VHVFTVGAGILTVEMEVDDEIARVRIEVEDMVQRGVLASGISMLRSRLGNGTIVTLSSTRKA